VLYVKFILTINGITTLDIATGCVNVDTVDEIEYETDMSGFVPLHNAEGDMSGSLYLLFVVLMSG
jgi:hypothetical protein